MKPKKIANFDIFGQDWKAYIGQLNPEDAGLCEYAKRKITINRHIPENSDLWIETLLHEILHASFERCSYKQSGLPHELEEVMIDQLAKIITENRKILKKLL